MRMILLPEDQIKRIERRGRIILLLLGTSLGVILGGIYFQSELYRHIQEQTQVTHKQEEELASLREWRAEREAQVEKASTYIKKKGIKLSKEQIKGLAEAEVKYAHKYRVPLALGLAISSQESHWDAKAMSPTGPLGIKQVAPSYWASELKMSRKDFFNPTKNIEAGYKIIRSYKDRTNSWEEALAKYYGSASLATNRGYAKRVLQVASNY